VRGVLEGILGERIGFEDFSGIAARARTKTREEWKRY
jgi:hypothetical protein